MTAHKIQIAEGNIWSFLSRERRIVISTNFGWDPTHRNRNNMGSGLAMQARDRYADLAVWYGNQCRKFHDEHPRRKIMPLVEYRRSLVLVSVKPLLDPHDPERSWNQPATMSCVRRGLRQLRDRTKGQVALTLIGSGNGGLDEDAVEDAIHDVLGGCRRFVLVKLFDKR